MSRYGRLANLIVATPSALVALLAVAVNVGCVTRDKTAGQGDKLPAAPSLIDSSRAESALAELAPTEPELAASARRRMAALQAREDEMTGWVLPLLRSYLPAGAPIQSHVYLGAKLPQPIAADENGVYIDIASPVLGDADDALWNNIVRAIYRQALIAISKDRSSGKKSDVAEYVLMRLQLEGLVAYVASQGRPDLDSARGYDAFTSRSEATQRFVQLDDAFLALGRGAAERGIISELDTTDAKDSLYAVVGGSMALAIERQGGREALVETIIKGPTYFYDAYQKTEPGALVNFRVPGSRPTPTGELDVPNGARY